MKKDSKQRRIVSPGIRSKFKKREKPGKPETDQNTPTPRKKHTGETGPQAS